MTETDEWIEKEAQEFRRGLVFAGMGEEWALEFGDRVYNLMEQAFVRGKVDRTNGQAGVQLPPQPRSYR